MVINIAKISVIVPVHNSEKYIERCIESILNQKFRDLELILVNDGSTDNSFNIIEKYASKNKMIKVINKEKGGVSSARNAGIDAASGDYIGFVDADDWIHPDMYESMYEKIKETRSEICICNFVAEYPNQKLNLAIDENKKVLSEDDKNRIILNMIAPNDLSKNSYTVMGSACRLLVKRELIQDNNIKFPLGIPLMEDLIFCINAFIRCRQIAIEEGFYYHYFLDSAYSYREDLYEIHKKVYRILERIVRDNNLYDMVEPILKTLYVNMCLTSVYTEARSMNRKKLRDKLAFIKRICRDKKLKQILDNLPVKDLKLKRKLILFALKHELGICLYAYYKMVILKYALKYFRNSVFIRSRNEKSRSHNPERLF